MTDKNIAYLRLLNGPAKGGVFVLKDLSVFDIGRGDTCQIRLQDPGICSSHARIYRRGETWTFYDLNSDQGSSVNDIPVEKRVLDGGEILRIGHVELHFGFDAPGGKKSTPAAPAPAARPPEPPKASPPRAQREPWDAPREEPTGQLQGFEADESARAAGRLQLRVIDGDSRDLGKQLGLEPDADYVIGRSNNCSLVLNDGKVSRLHCRIESHGEEFVLTDLNSANGTIVNGERVSQASLRLGDYLRLGFTVLTYEKTPVEVEQ